MLLNPFEHRLSHGVILIGQKIKAGSIRLLRRITPWAVKIPYGKQFYK